MAASAPSIPATQPRRFRGLVARVASALVLGPLVLAALWYGFPWIDLIVAIAAPIVVSECVHLTPRRPVVRVLAVAYALGALVALLWLRHQPGSGRETVLWVVAVVWATDIGAYFLGKLAGGIKLAPRISPGKTWSGLIGGMCWAAVASAGMGLVFEQGATFGLAAIGVVLAIVAQMGDLLESAAKRDAGVKDSGHLIPGHGGVLDRIDGLVAVLVVVALARLVIGGDWPWA